MSGRGGPAQARRRARRASARAKAQVVRQQPETISTEDFAAAVGWGDYEASLTAGASGDTGLPLSDRNTPWDAGAARKSLSDAQFGDAHFWKDPDGPADQIGSYKLPFAKVVGGTLTAIWRGVTAGAARLSQTDIPDADKKAVQGKMGAYYSKAAKQYDDPDIKPPWEADSSKGESAAILIAYAEDHDGLMLLYDDGVFTGVSGTDERMADFAERVAFWEAAESWSDDEFAEAYANARCADCGHTQSMHGGKKGNGACFANGCDCGSYAAHPEKKAEKNAVDEDIIANLELAEAQAYAYDAMRNYFITTAGEMTTGGTTTWSFKLTDFEFEPVVTFSDNITFQGADDPDIPEAHQKKEVLPPKRPSPPAPEPTDSGTPEVDDDGEQMEMNWSATIAPEGTPTDDGRIFAPNAISWRDLPLSLGVMQDTPHADVVTASPVCGRIDSIYREGNLIKASGVFSPNDIGRETARQVSSQELRGVSVDVAVARMEIAWRSQILDAQGNWKGGDAPSESEDSPDLLDILFDPDPNDQVMFVVWDGIIGAVTICPFPAFSEANIKPASSLVAAANETIWTVTQQHGMVIVGKKVDAETLSASALAEEVEAPSIVAPLKPPAEWFRDPQLETLTPLTVREDGHIYGHAAPWGECHIGIPGVCTTAPHSITGYAYFHLKEVLCEEGERVSCGTITLGTGHAGKTLGRADAAAHYDNTGSAVADIVCGEDEHGIWYAGALRSDLSEETIRSLRGAAVSGDWRGVNGNLEMVALLAVNVPGFPVPKFQAELVASAEGFETVALVACGIHAGADGLSLWEQRQFEVLQAEHDGSWDALAVLHGEA